MSTPGTVNYPTSLDDAVSLLQAVNSLAETTLTSSLAIDATTANVTSTAGFAATGAVVFGGVEVAYYTGKTGTTLTGLIRGADGTSAAAHLSGATAGQRHIARHHTVLAEAIIAAQTKLDSHAHSFASLTAKPTTLSGYGITDAFTQAAADALYSALGHTHSFASLTSKPNTIAGYGITDAFTKTESDNRFAALAHAHALADITGLLSGGKIATGLLPALAITNTFVVASQAAMLALTAETGDIAVRSDQSKTYILKGADPSLLADWELLQTPTDAVLSVNGQTGVVSLTAADVGALTQAGADALYSALGHTHTFSSLTSKPTTIGGYGITDFNSLGDARWSLLAHVHAAGDVTSGVLAGARIATGTPDGTKFLRDDQVWTAVSASDATKLPLAGGVMTGTITSTMVPITADTPALSFTQTWNAAGVAFKGIFGNITNTASAAGARLIDLQVASASKFSVDKNGTILCYSSSSPSVISIGQTSSYGLSFNSGDGATYHVHNGVGSVGLFGIGVKVISTGGLLFSSGAIAASVDTALHRNAAGVVEVNNGTAGTFAALSAKEHRFTAPTSANGQYAAVKSLTELTTIAAAATTDTTIQMPANSVVWAVSARVTTAITCTSTFDIGDSGNATRFGTGVSKAVNTTKEGAVTPYLNASALSVRITPDTTPTDATGRVRITIHYIQIQPPTS